MAAVSPTTQQQRHTHAITAAFANSAANIDQSASALLTLLSATAATTILAPRSSSDTIEMGTSPAIPTLAPRGADDGPPSRLRRTSPPRKAHSAVYEAAQRLRRRILHAGSAPNVQPRSSSEEGESQYDGSSRPLTLDVSCGSLRKSSSTDTFTREDIDRSTNSVSTVYQAVPPSTPESRSPEIHLNQLPSASAASSALPERLDSEGARAAEPSLYAAIFGPTVANQLQAAATARPTPSTPPRTPSGRSLRMTASSPLASPSSSRMSSGLSARLHRLSSMPQLGSPERARRGGPPVGIDPHNAPDRAALEREEELAFSHPHQSFVVYSPRRKAKRADIKSKCRRFVEDDDDDYYGAFGSPSPSAKRKRIKGPSLPIAVPRPVRRSDLSSSSDSLPGQRPLAPLVPSMGFNSDSKARNHDISSPENRELSEPHRGSSEDHMAETDRLVGVLSAMADQRRATGVAPQPDMSPPRRRPSTFADPSSITPRKAKVNGSTANVPSTPSKGQSSTLLSEGDALAANVLLGFSNSPTPGSAVPRDAVGATPSLLSSLSKGRNSSAAATSQERSTSERPTRRYLDAAHLATSPLPRPGAMALHPAETTDGSADTPGQRQRRKSGTRRVSASGSPMVGDEHVLTPGPVAASGRRSRQATFDAEEEHSSELAAHPPRTPSPTPSSASAVPDTPRTPHTSAGFAYSEFVNVSPSPQPRSRGPSGRFVAFADGDSWHTGSEDGGESSRNTSRVASPMDARSHVLTPGPLHPTASSLLAAGSPTNPSSAWARRSRLPSDGWDFTHRDDYHGAATGASLRRYPAAIALPLNAGFLSPSVKQYASRSPSLNHTPSSLKNTMYGGHVRKRSTVTFDLGESRSDDQLSQISETPRGLGFTLENH